MSIDYISSNSIAEITLNRPQVLNALDPEAVGELRESLIRARDDDDVMAIVIRGAGSEAFCVGADIKQTMTSPRNAAQGLLANEESAIAGGMYIRGFDLTTLEIWKPIIAAINGYCLGGGLELALQCDLRIASNSASFALPEVKIGSIPAVGGLQRLLRTLPSALAMKMLLTGSPLTAEEAVRYGLVSDLVSTDQLPSAARQLADQIASCGPLAVRSIKLLAWEGYNVPLRDALLLEKVVWGLLRDTDDRIEGRRAFAEKRAPKFTGS